MEAVREIRPGASIATRTAPVRELPDEVLVQLVREGSEPAFEAVYDRYRDPLLSFCRHMLGSREDGEDAAQQTFLSAHRALIASSASVDLRPWLFTIARNRCLDVLRARRATEPLEEDREGIRAPTEGLLETVQRREDLRCLLSDIAALPEEQRAALVLFELGGLSQQQLGEILDCRPGKVKALVYQARSALMSDRDARQLECRSVREDLATARGHDLLRSHLRRHLRVCSGCREFATGVRHQRDAMALILPVLPSAGLKAAVLSSALGSAGSAGSAAAGGAGAGLVGAGALSSNTAGGAAAVLAAGAPVTATVAASSSAAAASGGVSTLTGVMTGLAGKGLVLKALALISLVGAAGGAGVALQKHRGAHRVAPAAGLRATHPGPAAAPNTAAGLPATVLMPAPAERRASGPSGLTPGSGGAGSDGSAPRPHSPQRAHPGPSGGTGRGSVLGPGSPSSQRSGGPTVAARLGQGVAPVLHTVAGAGAPLARPPVGAVVTPAHVPSVAPAVHSVLTTTPALGSAPPAPAAPPVAPASGVPSTVQTVAGKVQQGAGAAVQSVLPGSH